MFPQRLQGGDRPPELVNLAQFALSDGLKLWLSRDRDPLQQLAQQVFLCVLCLSQIMVVRYSSFLAQRRHIIQKH